MPPRTNSSPSAANWRSIFATSAGGPLVGDGDPALQPLHVGPPVGREVERPEPVAHLRFEDGRADGLLVAGVALARRVVAGVRTGDQGITSVQRLNMSSKLHEPTSRSPTFTR